MSDDWELGGEIVKEHFLLTERLKGIPFAEYAISYAVDWIDPDTGIIAEPGRDWGEYASLEPTLKTYGSFR